jgi:hypothetical protein
VRILIAAVIVVISVAAFASVEVLVLMTEPAVFRIAEAAHHGKTRAGTYRTQQNRQPMLLIVGQSRIERRGRIGQLFQSLAARRFILAYALQPSDGIGGRGSFIAFSRWAEIVLCTSRNADSTAPQSLS